MATVYLPKEVYLRIKALIKKWGGTVSDTISIETDFVVFGQPPKVLRKPTFEEMELYPMAMQKYEASLANLEHYNEVQQKSQALLIPVFNYDRFLYLTGYKSQASMAGAF